MSNKEKLIRVIEQDINPKDYYNVIINEIEKGDEMKKKKFILKYLSIPICLILVFVGVLYINYKNNDTLLNNNPNIDKKNDVILNINEINKEVGIAKIDADVEIITNDDFDYIKPYKNEISIPKDLDKTDMYIYYFRENKESNEYNILGNYEIVYSSDTDRSINVKYGEDYKPIRDYYFEDDVSKITSINNIDIKIYKFNNNYYTEFSYNDYNLNIETHNITESELIDLLVSILK